MFRFKKYNENEIPYAAGIYAFLFDGFNPQKAGLIGRGEFSERQNSIAKSQILAKLDKLDKLNADILMTGYLSEEYKNVQTARKLIINGTSAPSFAEENLRSRIENIGDPYRLLKVLEVLELLIPPLYIGITYDRTLNQRWNEHARDYESGDQKNTFGARLKKSALSWEDVCFYAVEFPVELTEKEVMSLSEKLMQGLTKPIFCLK